MAGVVFQCSDVYLSLSNPVVLLYSACSGYRMLRNHQKSLRLRFSVNQLLINIYSTIRMLSEVQGTLTWFSAIVVRLKKMNLSMPTIAVKGSLLLIITYFEFCFQALFLMTSAGQFSKSRVHPSLYQFSAYLLFQLSQCVELTRGSCLTCWSFSQ